MLRFLYSALAVKDVTTCIRLINKIVERTHVTAYEFGRIEWLDATNVYISALCRVKNILAEQGTDADFDDLYTQVLITNKTFTSKCLLPYVHTMGWHPCQFIDSSN